MALSEFVLGYTGAELTDARLWVALIAVVAAAISVWFARRRKTPAAALRVSGDDKDAVEPIVAHIFRGKPALYGRSLLRDEEMKARACRDAARRLEDRVRELDTELAYMRASDEHYIDRQRELGNLKQKLDDARSDVKRADQSYALYDAAFDIAQRRSEFANDDAEFEKLLTGGHAHAQTRDKLERKYGAAVVGVCVGYLKEQRRATEPEMRNATATTAADPVFAPVNAIYSTTQPGRFYIPGSAGRPPAWVYEEGYASPSGNVRPRAGSVGRAL